MRFLTSTKRIPIRAGRDTGIEREPRCGSSLAFPEGNPCLQDFRLGDSWWERDEGCLGECSRV